MRWIWVEDFSNPTQSLNEGIFGQAVIAASEQVDDDLDTNLPLPLMLPNVHISV